MIEKFINQMEPWIDENEVNHMSEYLRSGAWLTEFKKTQEFEKMLADYIGAKHCIVVANGTISMSIAYWAAGIGQGDEVLVPNFTMIATPNAVRLAGATPVLVDIEPGTLCMDIEKAKQALTSKTKAICIVSLNGRSPEMLEWQKLCKEKGLFLIEDSAQSLGSFHANKHLGTFGDMGSFSFSAPKIITTGQGGALVTDNDELAGKIRKIKDFGRERGGIDWHDLMGYNFKVTDMQSVIGIEQMKKLPWRIKRKKEIYKLYETQLASIDAVEMIPTREESTPWFIDIYVENPAGLQAYLKSKNVGTRSVYPPISQQKIYPTTQSFPVSENYCQRGLWLPSSSFLTDEQILQICDAIKGYFKGISKK
jgi:perosamine synthetase